MKSVLKCKTQVSALIQRTWNEFLMLSKLPNPTAWEWGCQSVVLLLNVTADGSGPYRTMVPAQPFVLLSIAPHRGNRFTYALLTHLKEVVGVMRSGKCQSQLASRERPGISS